MLEGIIIKGIGGFYYVKVNDNVYECRARGLFRKKKITPLVGDRVLIKLNKEDNTGYIEQILDRKSELIRPPVANVSQVLIVFAAQKPEPNLWLLDRFLLLVSVKELDAVICINKIDLDSDGKADEIYNIYKKAGYKVIKTSCKTNEGMDEAKSVLKGEITVLAGPSGVGKSTLLNSIQSNLKLQTGEISAKTNRGKHTTRHVELMELNIGGWVLDTPGFSTLDINFLEENELQKHFLEIYAKSDFCKFTGCNHYKEPGCEVKNAVENGEISDTRYLNYINMLEEIKRTRRY